jgi:hypothetical protein
MRSVLGLCNYTFLGLLKCQNCKRFNACHERYTKFVNGAADAPTVPDTSLMNKEAWKGVNPNDPRAKKLKYKIEASLAASPKA